MKRYRVWIGFVLLFSLLCGIVQGDADETNTTVSAQDGDSAVGIKPPPPLPDTAPGLTYIIPVEGEVERGLLYVFRRGISEARKEGATAIVLDMKTLGGRVDVTREMVQLLLALGDEIETYTFVNNEAISAGAMLSFATQKIYMSPGSYIGASTPILAAPGGSAQKIPERYEEKIMSFVLAIIRAAAQQNGHDVKVAEAMVRPEPEYRIGDDVICASNQLLTLTNVEAERMVGEGENRRHLLSLGTVKDMDTLLETIGRKDSPVKTFRITAPERFARFIEIGAVSSFLLTLGMLGLYVEFRTPGFGIPGIMGILFLALWFWGHNIAGLAGMEELILLVVGLVLLAVEIFLIPGFGFVGLAGVVMILISIVMAMVEHYPGGSILPPLEHVTKAVTVLGMAMVLTSAMVLLLARFLPQTRVFDKLALAASTSTADGFLATQDTTGLVGLSGRAVTALRPGGIGMFGDRRLDVVTHGDFIDTGQAITIVETHGNRIVVEPSETAGA